MLMFNCSDLFTYPRPFCGYHVICSVGMELLFKSFHTPLPQLRLKSIAYLASKASDKRLWPCSLMSLGNNSPVIQVKLGEKTAFIKELSKWVNGVRKLRDVLYLIICLSWRC